MWIPGRKSKDKKDKEVITTENSGIEFESISLPITSIVDGSESIKMMKLVNSVQYIPVNTIDEYERFLNNEDVINHVYLKRLCKDETYWEHHCVNYGDLKRMNKELLEKYIASGIFVDEETAKLEAAKEYLRFLKLYKFNLQTKLTLIKPVSNCDLLAHVDRSRIVEVWDMFGSLRVDFINPNETISVSNYRTNFYDKEKFTKPMQNQFFFTNTSKVGYILTPPLDSSIKMLELTKPNYDKIMVGSIVNVESFDEECYGVVVKMGKNLEHYKIKYLGPDGEKARFVHETLVNDVFDLAYVDKDEYMKSHKEDYEKLISLL